MSLLNRYQSKGSLAKAHHMKSGVKSISLFRTFIQQNHNIKRSRCKIISTDTLNKAFRENYDECLTFTKKIENIVIAWRSCFAFKNS